MSCRDEVRCISVFIVPNTPCRNSGVASCVQRLMFSISSLAVSFLGNDKPHRLAGAGKNAMTDQHTPLNVHIDRNYGDVNSIINLADRCLFQQLYTAWQCHCETGGAEIVRRGIYGTISVLMLRKGVLVFEIVKLGRLLISRTQRTSCASCTSLATSRLTTYRKH